MYGVMRLGDLMSSKAETDSFWRIRRVETLDALMNDDYCFYGTIPNAMKTKRSGKRTESAVGGLLQGGGLMGWDGFVWSIVVVLGQTLGY